MKYNIFITFGVKDDRGMDAYYFEQWDIGIDENIYITEDDRINQIKIFLTALNTDIKTKLYSRIVQIYIAKKLIPVDIGDSEFKNGILPAGQIANDVRRLQKQKYQDSGKKQYFLFSPESVFENDITFNENDVVEFLRISKENNIILYSFYNKTIDKFLKSEYIIL